MALPISETIHTNIKAKAPVDGHRSQFDDGLRYGYQVVDTALKPEFVIRKGQPVVANGDLNIVLWEVDSNGKGLQVALLLTEADLRRAFDGVPD